MVKKSCLTSLFYIRSNRAFLVFDKYFANKELLFQTDNIALVTILNKKIFKIETVHAFNSSIGFTFDGEYM